MPRSSRYDAMFARLAQRGEAALVPFLVLGDPTPAVSARLLRALVEGGADAIELGIPFSDAVADGPVIQAASARALSSGTTTALAFKMVRGLRREYPGLPIGLLMYANLVFRAGVDRFYGDAAEAGVDSVLIADVPLVESGPFHDAAEHAGVAPVYVAPPNASATLVRDIAARSQGYVYLTSRAGVTGESDHAAESLAHRIDMLRSFDAPPPMVGFGIGEPRHVRRVIECGAAGAIVGSALVRSVAAHIGDYAPCGTSVRALVDELKAATRPASPMRTMAAARSA